MTTCPKCGYVRKPSETVPDWECPSCGIAYAKFHAGPSVAHMAPRLAPLPGPDLDKVPDAKSYDRPFVHLVSFVSAIAFSWFVYWFTEESILQSDNYGWITGYELLRVIAVAFDIYVAGSFFNRDRKSTRLNSSHIQKSRMPSSA